MLVWCRNPTADNTLLPQYHRLISGSEVLDYPHFDEVTEYKKFVFMYTAVYVYMARDERQFDVKLIFCD